MSKHSRQVRDLPRGVGMPREIAFDRLFSQAPSLTVSRIVFQSGCQWAESAICGQRLPRVVAVKAYESRSDSQSPQSG